MATPSLALHCRRMLAATALAAGSLALAAPADAGHCNAPPRHRVVHRHHHVAPPVHRHVVSRHVVHRGHGHGHHGHRGHGHVQVQVRYATHGASCDDYHDHYWCLDACGQAAYRAGWALGERNGAARGYQDGLCGRTPCSLDRRAFPCEHKQYTYGYRRGYHTAYEHAYARGCAERQRSRHSYGGYSFSIRF